jgi:glycosyltransferase involved in cell wall biosynthesis
MHILVMPSWYTTARSPMRGSFFREQALALRKAGHQVGMLVPPSRLRTLNGLRETTANWQRPPDALDIEDDAGLMTYRLRWWGWSAALLPSRRGDLVLAAYDRYCREQGQPDVIHAHSILYAGYVAAAIKAARGVPVVLTEHAFGYLSPRWIMPDQRPRIRRTLDQTDARFAVSPALARALEACAPGVQVGVLNNTVDTALFTPPASEPPRAPFTFTIIGRLLRNKGHAGLLRAFAAAFHGDAARLLIGGDGPQRRPLERLAAQLGISDQVDFLGALDRQQVRDTLWRSHALVSASRFETFGLTLAEAMACGRPVIATRSGGPDSFVTPETGLLVPVDDGEALAAAMRRMAAQYDQYDAARIRTYAVDRFSERAITRQLEAVYAGIIARPGA